MSRHALIVGVANYHKDKTLSRLSAAHTDISVVGQVLRNRGDFEVKTLADPSHNELVRGLEDLFGSRSPGDTALVYFSGHGLTDDDKDRLYLAASDSEQGRLDSSAVNAQLLRQFTATTKAHCKLVFLDCCFAGLAGDGLRARNARRVPLSAQLNKHGTVILTASDRITPSFEDTKSPDRPALFTEAVVDALSGHANDSDGDGWISMQDVADYVQRTDKLSQQSPQMFANGVTGSIQLTRTTANTSGPSHLPTVVGFDGVPEPFQDPAAPLDDDTWKRLLNYYLACLSAETGDDDWLKPENSADYAAWPGGAEAIFSGAGVAVELPEPLQQYVTKRLDKPGTFVYGYPVVVFAAAGKAKFAPLVTTELEVQADGSVKAFGTELNLNILHEIGLEEPEIAEHCESFAANFRYGNPEHFTEQLRRLAKALDLHTPQEPAPLALSERLLDSPLVSGMQNLAIIHHLPDSNRLAIARLLQDIRDGMIPNIPAFAATALSALSHRQPADVGSYQTLVTPVPLNESQEAIVDSAMTRRLTVATGPPGTGKTALVTALTATAIANGQSILIGSTNNKAVDGVVEKADAITGGLLIRTGNKKIVGNEPEVLNKLIRDTKPADNPSLFAGRVRSSNEQLGGCRGDLDRRREIENDLLATVQELHRLRDQFDATPHAIALLDEVDKKLDTAAMRSRRSLRRWPSGIWGRYWLRRRFAIATVAARQSITRLLELEQQRRELESTLASSPNETELWDRAKALTQARTEHSVQLTDAVMSQHITRGRATILDRIDQVSRSRNTWRAFPKLLRQLPGWAVTGHSSRSVKPDPGLFDLVVIDEAAQCPVPMVIALLMRAKRALIIGDPHQIPPVAKLSESHDDLLRRKHKLGDDWLKDRKLNYVGSSIYHACAVAAGEVSLLDEHYRCDPAIVATPNRMVYQDQLAVLTDTARLAIPASPPEEPAVEVIDVRGKVDHPRSGSCYNAIEAEFAVQLASELRTKYPEASIGIVSPFRAHVNRVERQLQPLKLAPEVVVGTAHTFQGAECDIIILSPVGSDGISSSSAQWMLKQTNLWNVAITRAKSRLFVVCDRTWWTQQSSLLTELIDASEEDSHDDLSTSLIDRLQLAFESNGVPVLVRDKPIVGQPCHLQIGGPVTTRAVFIDTGQPEDGRAFRQLLAKFDLITNAGYEPIRVPAWRCLTEPDAVARELRIG